MPSHAPLSMLGGLTASDFLRDHWQQKPLLIRGAFAEFESPLSPDELAGLACEENVEARLVEEHGHDEKGMPCPWKVSHGPFSEDTFARLPERDWTLLVQAVDHYVPEVAELLEQFSFLPRWRLDDIMISYAPPGGSVGPHLDQYDVFLLQASGQRHWQLGGKVNHDAPIIEGIDLRILKHFNVSADHDWVLEPGDMLYLPPGWAHHGVSQSDDCLTISVGFRAPSADEVITSFADYLGEQLPSSLRYSDAGMKANSDTSELDDAAVARMRALILETLDDPAQVAQWFGRVMTQTKYPDQLSPSDTPSDPDELVSLLHDGETLERSPGSRFAWRAIDTQWATLFADGDGITVRPSLAKALANPETALDDRLLAEDGASEVLTRLLDAGSLCWPWDFQEHMSDNLEDEH